MEMNQEWENKKPVIRKFIVEGLFGYKTITLDFRHPAKIISAENGTGKTTLLNALYWMLTGQFYRLHAINFSAATIIFENGDEVSLERDELVKLDLGDVKSPLMINFRRWGLSKEQVSDLFTTYLAHGDGDVLTESEAYVELYQNSPYDHDEIRDRIHAFVERFVDTEQFSSKKKKIEKGLQGVKLLYLPTYRRIEASLGFEKVQKVDKVESSKDRLIYFGLTDVEETLDNITAEIKTSTLEAYSKINGAFLDKLVDIAESKDSPSSSMKIDQDAMKTVLARIGKGSDDRTVIKIDELTRSGAIEEAKYSQLNYFLSELTQIGRSQAKAEDAINRFVNVINQYWKIAGGEKEFVYDKYKVEVFVKNNVANSRIPLHVLSSGEKQIVSIFSRLTFGEANEYFVIIDEPELSLSIEWQKLFLPDIMFSSKCRSLLAITHSPFVFENQLDKYASSLDSVSWSKK